MYGSSPIELLACQAMLDSRIYAEAFTYSASWISTTGSALGATGSTEVQIQINGDSDFVVQEMNLQAYTAGPTLLTDPDYLLTITRAGSGRQLMNQAQHVLTICGNFQTNHVPSHLPMPFLCQASNIISCLLQNLTATAALRVDLALIGFKVFYTGGNRQEIFHCL